MYFDNEHPMRSSFRRGVHTSSRVGKQLCNADRFNGGSFVGGCELRRNKLRFADKSICISLLNSPILCEHRAIGGADIGARSVELRFCSGRTSGGGVGNCTEIVCSPFADEVNGCEVNAARERDSIWNNAMINVRFVRQQHCERCAPQGGPALIKYNSVAISNCSLEHHVTAAANAVAATC